jgi:hypothetical protein
MIEEIDWTDHAYERLRERKVDEAAIKATVRSEHPFRSRNRGAADWEVIFVRQDGKRFRVLYDHPVDGDDSRARVVTILRLGRFRRG